MLRISKFPQVKTTKPGNLECENSVTGRSSKDYEHKKELQNFIPRQAQSRLETCSLFFLLLFHPYFCFPCTTAIHALALMLFFGISPPRLHTRVHLLFPLWRRYSLARFHQSSLLALFLLSCFGLQDITDFF